MERLTLVLLAITSLLFTSCSSTYYYSTLNTLNEDVVKVDNGDFLFENDSLWIAHCFKGEDAPIQITVFNKLDVPLFVDWNRSSLILNNIAHPYNDGRVTYVGNTEGVAHEDIFFNGVYHTYSSLEATMHTPQHVSFIPPKTMVTHSTLRLAARFDEIKDKEYVKARLGTTQNEVVEMKRIGYNEQNTPLRFASYLTIYAKPENVQAYNTHFYVTNLMKTQVKPEHLPADMADRGDTFYQQKRPNNTGWHILAGTALVAGSIAIDVWVSNDDCYNCY